MATTAAVSVLEPADAPALVAPEPLAASHPHRKSLAILALGYGSITVVLLGIGMLLTHPLAASVGGWDLRSQLHTIGANDLEQWRAFFIRRAEGRTHLDDAARDGSA